MQSDLSPAFPSRAPSTRSATVQGGQMANHPLPSGPGALSEVLLQDLRVERAHAQILHINDDVALAVTAVHQPILYVGLEGAVTIQLAGEECAELRAGDNALIFYGDGHQLGSGPRRLKAVATTPGQELADNIRNRFFGHGNRKAVVLQCVLELGYLSKTAYASRAAPNLLMMSAQPGGGRQPSLTAFPFSPPQLLSNLSGPGTSALACAFANMQLCHGLKQLTSSMWGQDFQDVRSPNTRRIAAVIREIRAHPDRNWTVRELARHVGLSRSAFAAAFQEMLGEPPIAFLTRERMERAAKLLCNEALTMHEVAQRVGYEVESSFARAFKRHWGMAPRRFTNRASQNRGQ